MEAERKADNEFCTFQQSQHKVTDAASDIRKMSAHILECQASTEIKDRVTPVFIDPIEDGWKKLSKGWLDRILTEMADVDEDESILEEEHRILDLDYELYNV